jgi:hypothetical protein
MRRFLLPLTVALLVFLPALAHADASVVQDSCVIVGVPPNASVWTYMTVINFSLPVAICDLHFLPEPQPPSPGCEMINVIAPPGWSVFLNPFGGADWFANTPNDCIQPGSAKGEFAFLLDPDFCCYIVQFTDATGAVILEQEECFTCQKVGTEVNTWGKIKALYGNE